MTLHEAIVKILEQNGQAMTTSEIAKQLNTNGWYKKRDGSQITAFQIHGRTRKYSNLFDRNGSIVSLVGVTSREKKDPENKIQGAIMDRSIYSYEASLFEEELINIHNFKSVEHIDTGITSQSGLYCIRVKNVDALPTPFNEILKQKEENIIYIGIASNLKNRLNQELRAMGHGTFFRSMGAVLGFSPPQGSLINMANKRNYKFSNEDKEKIIQWMNKNLLINWSVFNGDIEEMETKIIKKYHPLFNIDKNDMASEDLKILRGLCVKVANTPVGIID